MVSLDRSSLPFEERPIHAGSIVSYGGSVVPMVESTGKTDWDFQRREHVNCNEGYGNVALATNYSSPANYVSQLAESCTPYRHHNMCGNNSFDYTAEETIYNQNQNYSQQSQFPRDSGPSPSCNFTSFQDTALLSNLPDGYGVCSQSFSAPVSEIRWTVNREGAVHSSTWSAPLCQPHVVSQPVCTDWQQPLNLDQNVMVWPYNLPSCMYQRSHRTEMREAISGDSGGSQQLENLQISRSHVVQVSVAGDNQHGNSVEPTAGPVEGVTIGDNLHNARKRKGHTSISCDHTSTSYDKKRRFGDSQMTSSQTYVEQQTFDSAFHEDLPSACVNEDFSSSAVSEDISENELLMVFGCPVAPHSLEPPVNQQQLEEVLPENPVGELIQDSPLATSTPLRAKPCKLNEQEEEEEEEALQGAVSNASQDKATVGPYSGKEGQEMVSGQISEPVKEILDLMETENISGSETMPWSILSVQGAPLLHATHNKQMEVSPVGISTCTSSELLNPTSPKSSQGSCGTNNKQKGEGHIVETGLSVFPLPEPREQTQCAADDMRSLIDEQTVKNQKYQVHVDDITKLTYSTHSPAMFAGATLSPPYAREDIGTSVKRASPDSPLIRQLLSLPNRSSTIGQSYLSQPFVSNQQPQKGFACTLSRGSIVAGRKHDLYQNKNSVAPLLDKNGALFDKVVGLPSSGYVDWNQPREGKRPDVNYFSGQPLMVSGQNCDSQGENVQIGTVSLPPVPPWRVSTWKQTKGMHKPRNFRMKELQIGTFKFSNSSIEGPVPLLAKIKLIFSTRKLVYQFETGTFPHNRNVKLLVNIEVPFSTIVGLHAHFSTIQVEVNRAPYIFPGYKLVTEGSSYQPFFHTRHINDHCDVTGGQFKTCPYHKITLKMNTALNFKKYLSGFDERLDGLFKKPFIELTGKTLPVVSGFGEGNNIYPGIDFSNPIEEPTKTPVMLTSQLEGSARCECTVSGAEGGICSTLSCGCLSLGKKCSDCQCIGCTNPLNILTQVGIGLQEIQDDPCLFQNLTKIQNLPQYLECNIHFPCCGCSAKLKYCIPSTVLCPNYPACKQAYKYSWCIGELCSEVDSPRNHCVECKYCRRTGDVHCQKCKRCYFSGPSGFRCPGCTETDLNSSSPNHLIDLFNAMVTDMKTWNSDTA